MDQEPPRHRKLVQKRPPDDEWVSSPRYIRDQTPLPSKHNNDESTPPPRDNTPLSPPERTPTLQPLSITKRPTASISTQIPHLPSQM
uniref:Uncharacterized protein n=1 Tax=Cucumis melo TaxID=3656 RepID=A0A9I9DJK4_CUCME